MMKWKQVWLTDWPNCCEYRPENGIRGFATRRNEDRREERILAYFVTLPCVYRIAALDVDGIQLKLVDNDEGNALGSLLMIVLGGLLQCHLGLNRIRRM